LHQGYAAPDIWDSCLQVGMTTGATIHTTAGLHMTVTRRSHPFVTEEATLTNIEDDDLVKEYQSL